MSNRYLRMTCVRIEPCDSYREFFTFRADDRDSIAIRLPFVKASFKVGEAIDLEIRRVMNHKGYRRCN